MGNPDIQILQNEISQLGDLSQVDPKILDIYKNIIQSLLISSVHSYERLWKEYELSKKQ